MQPIGLAMLELTNPESCHGDGRRQRCTASEGKESAVGYKRIHRPMFPLEQDIFGPDLSVKWVPSSSDFID